MALEYTTEILSRIQFAFTIGFHIVFPTLNIGLGLFLVIMEGLWLKTQQAVYYKICRFWGKIFALTFGMGVVSGVVLHYEIGTNFSHMTKLIGPVLGPLFSYEVMTAFFLESGFLGIMLFGWHRVGKRLHFAATCLVAVGTIISAFWIMSANSWMQTPTGASLGADGIYHVNSWVQVIFNPSVVARFIHMILASLVTTTFVVAGISAWYLLKNRHIQLSKLTLRFAMACALILVPGQIIVGDLVGLNVHHYQPIKTAAIEANWQTQRGAPLILFGIPNDKTASTSYAISIPKLGSLINTHDMNGELQGLDSVDRSEWPMVAGVFYSFRIMVGIGFIFLALAGMGYYIRVKDHAYQNYPWFLKGLLASIPLGFIATITGWMTAELGRQPWTVYGLVKTHDIVSDIPAAYVSLSLGAFAIIYALISIAYFVYLFKVIAKGPVAATTEPETTIAYMDHALPESDTNPRTRS